MEPEPASLFCLLPSLPFLWAIGSNIITSLIVLVFLLIGSALVSGSEVAYFSLSPADMDQIREDGSPSSRRILWLKDNPNRLLATILIANNFINIAIVLLSEYVLSTLLPTQLVAGWAQSVHDLPLLRNYSIESLTGVISFLITVIGVTFLLVLFGEVAPKVYARFNSVRLAHLMSTPISLLMQLFAIPSMLLVNGSRIIERRLAARTAGSQTTSREDIDEAIELTVSSEEDNAGPEVDILKRIVAFSDVNVHQIMRSRVDIVAVDYAVHYGQLLDIIRESGYSRIPVYQEDLDDIVGLLYVKDLLGHLGEPPTFVWQQLIRTETLFVPDSKKINELLRQFQYDKMHMAIVVDEYGGTAGLVTLEDILEEIIGDIQDEFDDEPEVIYQQIDDLNYVFDGKTLLNDVCRVMGLSTDTFDEVKGEADSFAGLVLEMVGDMPQVDQEIIHHGYRFKVVSVSDRRIEEILITLPDPAAKEQ